MKIWHIVGGVLVGLLLLYPRPNVVSMKQQQRQEQQEDPRIMQESLERLSFKVDYHSATPSDDATADIMWLKKAADVALSKGNPYFNVMERRLIRSSRWKKGQGRNSVEGVIQLSPDPMSAEYDAREIRALMVDGDR